MRFFRSWLAVCVYDEIPGARRVAGGEIERASEAVHLPQGRATMTQAARVDWRELKQVVREHFGFRRFRPGQERAVQAAMQGRDTIVIMPTGSGKSLCFQLPALALEGTTIVVSPLIVLMKDQTDSLKIHGSGPMSSTVVVFLVGWATRSIHHAWSGRWMRTPPSLQKFFLPAASLCAYLED